MNAVLMNFKVLVLDANATPTAARLLVYHSTKTLCAN